MNEVSQRMIFHVPFALNPQARVANEIRPLKMMDAFREAGFDVTVIAGTPKERHEKISGLKKEIRAGAKYGFVYSENSPLPTPFSDGSPWPRRPLQDLLFLQWCRRHDLPVGMFYRDIYWRFPASGQYRSQLRRRILTAFYVLDLIVYRFSLKRLYVMSPPMKDLLPLVRRSQLGVLPPGSATLQVSPPNPCKGKLRFLYVGGVGELYDPRLFLEVIQEFSDVTFTLCTREADWKRFAESVRDVITERVKVVHLGGDDLDALYEESDICLYFLRPTPYARYSLSFKVFEYIAHQRPILAVEDTHIGDLVAQGGVGWSLPFDAQELRSFIRQCLDDPNQVRDMGPALELASKVNAWVARAKEVAEDLTEC